MMRWEFDMLDTAVSICRCSMKTIIAFCLALSLFVPLHTAHSAPPNGGRMILAVHPYLPYAELMRRYRPLARYLSDWLGRPVQIRVGRDYQEHLEHVGRDLVDIAFMGPASYVECTERFGPKPLLARLEVHGEPEFKGAIVVRQDSRIENLAQLRGRRIAFGDRNSTMSYLLPRHMLKQAGIGLTDLGQYQFMGSHTNVALGVLAGDFDAGGVKEEVYRQFKDKGLRLLAWTPALSEHLFVTRSNLDPLLVRSLRGAMLQLGSRRDAPGILGAIKPGLTGLVPVQDADYENLRRVIRDLSEDAD